MKDPGVTFQKGTLGKLTEREYDVNHQCIGSKPTRGAKFITDE